MNDREAHIVKEVTLMRAGRMEEAATYADEHRHEINMELAHAIEVMRDLFQVLSHVPVEVTTRLYELSRAVGQEVEANE